MWLRMLALAAGRNVDRLQQELKTKNLSTLPYLGLLLKDRQDIEEVASEK